jgi:hypothetical protein
MRPRENTRRLRGSCRGSRTAGPSCAREFNGHCGQNDRRWTRAHLFRACSFSYSKATPAALVVALHRRLGTDVGLVRGFEVPRPSAQLPFSPWGYTTTNPCSSLTLFNDTKFISQLIDKLAAEYSIDAGRLYVAGMSNGGFMIGRLACELSEKIAALAIVGASLSVPTATACKASRAVSVLIIQGTKDPLVPYLGGGLGRNGPRGQILSHPDAVQKWVALNDCATQATKAQIPDKNGDGIFVDVAIHESCAEGTEVRDYSRLHNR